MAFAAGGELAAAISSGGGLGLVGGGYGDKAFITRALENTGDMPVGIGLISWSQDDRFELLDYVIEQNPTLIMLSFGESEKLAEKIHSAKIPLAFQCQNMEHVRQAVEWGAQIVIAQGGEAGGHGAWRGTMNFVPEVADYLSGRDSPAILVAAGGIADGRGLAAALMLGAEGVLMGTRYWATHQCEVHPDIIRAGVQLTGDDTVKTDIPDIARNLNWPPGYAIRIGKNALVRKFHGKTDRLSREQREDLATTYQTAMATGNGDMAGIIAGEALGICNTIEDATSITESIAKQAINLIQNC